MDVGMDPIEARILSAGQEHSFQAASLWVDGLLVRWVDLSGVFHETRWDPFVDEICVNLPKEEE